MRIAGYCRVSTDKTDQLNSLEAQKGFFGEYTQKNGHVLVGLYADEGISGTKIRNRTEFQRLMHDAKTGAFEMVVVKDISRFARNTVDFLQSIRQLKALGVETNFLTANMSVLGNSEFVLTIFGALAQEESANTSKRIKFGKKISAEQGLVPNMVFGYDKVPGDSHTLCINDNEAKTVREIFRRYTEEGYGTSKIATALNEKRLRTKRDCDWTQGAVCRVLSNELYIGNIINGKQEVRDFLTGDRVNKEREEWCVVHRPELAIVDEPTFAKAQQLLKGRYNAFRQGGERQSNKHLFSTLIKCADCGSSFRRKVYKGKTEQRAQWVCTRRNKEGVLACGNAVVINEDDLVAALDRYFTELFPDSAKMLEKFCMELAKRAAPNKNSKQQQSELEKQLQKLRKIRKRYTDMYAEEYITKEELEDKLADTKKELEQRQDELAALQQQGDGYNVAEQVGQMFPNICDIVTIKNLGNEQLKKLIEQITVDVQGKASVKLKALQH